MEGICEAAAPYLLDAAPAVFLKLVRGEDDIEDLSGSFHPEFTHQILGQTEQIFGYKEPRIQLSYTAGGLKPFLSFSYADVVRPAPGEPEAEDCVKAVTEWLPENDVAADREAFAAAVAGDKAFKPVGEFVSSYSRGNRRFEIYRGHTDTPGLVEYHKRFQTFLIWFIEAASFLDLTDDRWTLFYLFEKVSHADGAESYVSAGLLTVYEYYAYSNTGATTSTKFKRSKNAGTAQSVKRPNLSLEALDAALGALDADTGATRRSEHIRPRISQMLVLPPFQKQGHGAELLQAAYRMYNTQDRVIDIAVEDPSENFTKLRDFVDCKNCLEAFPGSNFFQQPFSDTIAQQIRDELRIGRMQARRVFEILQLRNVDVNNPEAVKAYRLAIKNRIFQPQYLAQRSQGKQWASLSDEERTHMEGERKASRDSLQPQFEALIQEYEEVNKRLGNEPSADGDKRQAALGDAPGAKRPKLDS